MLPFTVPPYLSDSSALLKHCRNALGQVVAAYLRQSSSIETGLP
jgi:hypothetical protein